MKLLNGILYNGVFFVCIIISPLKIYAQNQKEIDSLKYVIATTQNDSLKLQVLIILNDINQNRKELMTGLKEQIMLAKKLKNDSATCLGYTQLGYFEFENNNYIASENYLNEGMRVAKQTNNYFYMGRISNLLMGVYDRKGDMVTALFYLKQGEELLIKVDKKINLTRLYCNASALYTNHNLLPKALFYARKAYATAQSSGNPEPVTTASWFLANSLRMVGKYDSAIYYFSNGLQIANKLGLLYTQGDMLRGLSAVYAEKRQYTLAKKYLSQAMAKYDSVHVTDRKIDCEESFAYLNFMNKDFDAVKDYIDIREKRFTEDSLNNKRYIYKWLANLALVHNNVDDWKKYYTKYEQAEALFTSDKLQKNMLEIEAKYNITQKESELRQKESENVTRLWIIAALGFGLIGIVIATVAQYRNFKNKQKLALQHTIIEKQVALVYERSRIATDMHDDLGAGLSRIRYMSAGMKNEIKDEGLKKDFDKIITGSDELVDKMNEIIWALNSSDEKLEDVLYYIRSQCSEMLDAAGIALQATLPEFIPEKILNSEEKRNLFLLVKEAVHNITKHAQASSVNIVMQIENSLHITIADNGSGFNVDESRLKGNGLGNFQKRMNSLKGTVDIKSGSNGTTVQFIMPL